MSTRSVFSANNCPASASSSMVVPDSAQPSVHQQLPTLGAAEAARSKSTPIPRRSCCERLCAAVTKCCGRIRLSNRPRNTITSEENNNADDNPPATRDPVSDSDPAISIEGEDFANVNNVVENIASPRRKSWLRKIIMPCCYRSKEPKTTRIELAVSPVSASLPNSGVESRGEESRQKLTDEDGQNIEDSGNSPETPGNEKQRSEEGSKEVPSADPEEISDLEIEKNENWGKGDGLVFGPHKDGGFFLNLLEIEEKRLQSRVLVASSRLEILENECEEAGEIRIAIGKANLLISKKFKQFRELCQTNLEQQKGAKIPESDAGATLNEDLEGFWDVVLIQVQQIDDLFNKNEASPPNKEIATKKKLVRQPTASCHSKPNLVKKSELATARDNARRKIVAARREAMKCLAENQPIPEQEVATSPSKTTASKVETPDLEDNLEGQELEDNLEGQELSKEQEIVLTCSDIAKELELYLELRIEEVEKQIDRVILGEVGSPSPDDFDRIIYELDELEEDLKIFSPYISQSKDEEAKFAALDSC